MTPQTKHTIQQILLQHSRLKYPNVPDEARYIQIHPDTNEKGIKKNMDQLCKAVGLLFQITDSKAKPIHNMEKQYHASGNTYVKHSFKFRKSEFREGHHDCEIKGYNHLWAVEIKAENEKTKYKDTQSDKQKEWEQYLKSIGIDYYIIHGMDDGLALVQKILIEVQLIKNATNTIPK